MIFFYLNDRPMFFFLKYRQKFETLPAIKIYLLLIFFSFILPLFSLSNYLLSLFIKFFIIFFMLVSVVLERFLSKISKICCNIKDLIHRRFIICFKTQSFWISMIFQSWYDSAYNFFWFIWFVPAKCNGNKYTSKSSYGCLVKLVNFYFGGKL